MAGKACATIVVFVVLTTVLIAVGAAQERFAPVPADILDRYSADFAPDRRVLEGLAAAGEASRLREPGTPAWGPTPEIRGLVEAGERRMEPTLAVEAVFVHPVDGAESRPGFELDLYNLLRSISTMRGIEYYSASRRRMRVMFHDAYVIAAPDSNARLADALVASVPDESRIYVFQDDASFGRNTYETTYTRIGNGFRVHMRNLSTMFFGILPLVGPGSLELNLFVLPADGHLVFYGHVGVKTISFFGLERQAADSFQNRIRALYRWFVGRSQLVFGRRS